MALQTAEALFTHIFRHYGVPEDIVFDRRAQFTSRVWKAFIKRLGVSISLTSGFHPESNGQVERVNQDVVDEWFMRAEETWEAARVHLQHAAPERECRPSQVWLSTRNLPLHLPCRKLGP
jgi:transposase InsO family protein